MITTSIRPSSYWPTFNQEKDRAPARMAGRSRRPNMHTLARQLIAQHASPHEGVLQMQFVNLAHERQIALTERARQVVHGASADAQ